MGNLVPACYHPGRQLNDPDDALFMLSNDVDFPEESPTSPKSHYAYQTPTERRFLKPHRDDRSQKQLLDSMDVTIALLEQAEELLRRENGGNNLDETLNDDDDGDDDDSTGDMMSHLTGSGSHNTGWSSSLRPVNTFTTTVSAMTQPCKNLGPKQREKKHPSKQNSLSRNCTPKILGHKTFEAKQQLQEQVHRALSLSARRNLGKSYVRSAQRFNNSDYNNNTSQFVNQCGGSGGGSCGGFLMFGWLEDKEKFRHMQRVRQHMSALYLKLHSNCALYYQRRLSRSLPDNPVTRAITKGVVLSSNLSTRPRNSSGDLGLLSSSDLSSDSESSMLEEYGGGVNGGMQFGSVGPPSWPVHMLVTDTVFLDLALTGSLGLVGGDRNQKLQHEYQQELLGVTAPPPPPGHCIVLLNRRSGVPLAVCGLKVSATNGPTVVRIYATKRRVHGQEVATTTRRLGLDWSSQKSSNTKKTSSLSTSSSGESTMERNANLPLYTWAEVVIEGSHPNPIHYSIFMASGTDGRLEDTASYFAVHETLGSPEVRVVGRTERDIPTRGSGESSGGGGGPLSGCAVLSLSRDDEFDDDMYFRLAIAKGIDPALFICFAGIVDEIMERSMRIQSQMRTEAVYKQTRK